MGLVKIILNASKYNKKSAKDRGQRKLIHISYRDDHNLQTTQNH